MRVNIRHIHAVLCHPKDVRNVGAAIRAAGNHGLGSIRIVTTQDFGSEDLFYFSTGSVDTLPVQFHSTLDDALEGIDQVIGTSRRTRDPLAPPFWPAAGLRARLDPKLQIAILFGTERTGLVREEVDRCQSLVWVPTTDTSPSLNLSQAVAIIGYELARPAPETVGPPVIAETVALRTPAKAREAIYRHIEGACETLTYPPGRNPELFTRRLRRILDRANPNHAEFGLFAGVFSELLRLYALIPDPDSES